MRLNCKSQAGVEFIILIGTILFFFIAFFYVIQQSKTDEVYENRNNILRDVALIVQDEIGFATGSSDGYSRTFILPTKIGPLEYEISIVDKSVYVRTTNGKHAISLPVSDVTGDILVGENTIRKEDGEVILNYPVPEE